MIDHRPTGKLSPISGRDTKISRQQILIIPTGHSDASFLSATDSRTHGRVLLEDVSSVFLQSPTAMDLHPSSPSSSTPRRKTRIELKYMTPHKVLLLILIHAYCTASIPPQSHAQVFALLLEHVDVSLSLSFSADIDSSRKSNPASFRPFRTSYLLCLHICQTQAFTMFYSKRSLRTMRTP